MAQHDGKIHSGKRIDRLFFRFLLYKFSDSRQFIRYRTYKFQKLLRYVLLLKHIYHVVRDIHPELVYITPNAGGKAFFKDFIVVQILKCMGYKVIVHYHNKGVSAYQSKWVYNFLYKRFSVI